MKWFQAPRSWIRRNSRAVALGIWITFLLLSMLDLLLNVLISLGVAPGEGFDPFTAFTLGTLTIGTIGALIVARMPEHPIGWIFCAHSLIVLVPVATYRTLAGDGDLPMLNWVMWFGSLFELVSNLLLLMIVPLLFPNGRLLSRRWKPLLILSIVTIVVIMIDGAFTAQTIRIDDREGVPNPVRIAPVNTVIQILRPLGVVAVPVGLLGGFLSLGIRFRRSLGVERLQIRWLLWMLGIVSSALVALLFGLVFAPGLVSLDDGVSPLALVLGGTALIGLSFGIPAVLGIAILRYKLYSIDLLVNRTLVYGALSIGLGAIYLGSVVLFQQILNPLTGSTDLAVAGSTLAVAALFQPLRRRIQGTVDRRFYRRKYDATRTIDTLSTRLRDKIDLDTLVAEVRAVVQETMQPASVSLWLREQQGQARRSAL